MTLNVMDMRGFPAAMKVGDQTLMEFHEDRVEIFTSGVRWATIRNGILFIDGLRGPSPSSSGGVGDIVLPNHLACLRGATFDGTRNLPMVKMNCYDTPGFGSTLQLKNFPHNEAKAIGWPMGLLIVTEAGTRSTATFIMSGPPENPITIDKNPSGLFSTRDAEGGKIVVCFDPNQMHPINTDQKVGGFQIQNRTGAPINLGWSYLGAL